MHLRTMSDALTARSPDSQLQVCLHFSRLSKAAVQLNAINEMDGGRHLLVLIAKVSEN